MPRLSPALLHHTAQQCRLLPRLLRECRDLNSARNELRWLREHAVAQATALQGATPRPRPRLQERQQHGKLPSSFPFRPSGARHRSGPLLPRWRRLLQGYVERREKGEPLQYIIGTQPFGELEVLCRRGVLIPRPETEVYVSRLGEDLIKKEEGIVSGRQHDSDGRGRRLRVLDLCTGTGCIPLHLYEMLSRGRSTEDGRAEDLDMKYGPGEIVAVGVDVSATVLDLAARNLKHNISLGVLPAKAGEDISFLQADILGPTFPSLLYGHLAKPRTGNSAATTSSGSQPSPRIDILTANPPYISPSSYAFPTNITSRSVRRYEPKLALVPETRAAASQPLHPNAKPEAVSRGDEFYHHILPLLRRLDVGITVLEVGDSAQAERVAELAASAVSRKQKQKEKEKEEEKKKVVVVEVWFDDGKVKEMVSSDGGRGGEKIGDGAKGEGISARAIVVWRREWAAWRRKTTTTTTRMKMG